MPDIATISAEKLCALTGLTDRRHRQMAKEGFFPPPIVGEYQLTPTISGVLRYYREMYQRTSRTLAEDKQVKMKREIELLDMKIAEQNKKLVSTELVESVWCGITAAMRQTILATDIPQNVKEELTTHLRLISPDEYIRKRSLQDSEESN